MSFPYQGMTPNQYQELALRTEETPPFVVAPGASAEENLAIARLMHAGAGLSSESGEIWDQVKKHLIYGKPLDKLNIIEEAGDQLWYLALALKAVGGTMQQAMEMNIAKLEKRYGDKFSKEKALNRDLDAERQVLENNR